MHMTYTYIHSHKIGQLFDLFLSKGSDVKICPQIYCFSGPNFDHFKKTLLAISSETKMPRKAQGVLKYAYDIHLGL